MNASEIDCAIALKVHPDITDISGELVFHQGECKKPAMYHSDANTRPQMLASLTEAQKLKLLKLVIRGNWSQGTALQLLELTQPQFCELFLKTLNLWKP